MTYSEVEEVNGYVGNFEVKVRRKARYIDEDKCTGCGSCLERCPVQHKPGDNGHMLPEIEMTPEMQRRVDQIIDCHKHEKVPIPAILNGINQELGFLPKPALRYLSQQLQVPLSRIYHIATFYTAYSLEPQGEHTIKVCLGTACYVRGSQRVLEAFEDRLEIKAGQTTPDMKFTLETVNCPGSCTMGPVVALDDRYLTVDPNEVEQLLRSYA